MTSPNEPIEINSLCDVWRKWSRRFGRFWWDRLGLVIGLVSYQVYKSGVEWRWW